MTDVGADREAYWQGTHTRVQEARQELVCPICIETLTEPRTLTCQHTFCTTCLQQLALSGLSRSAVKASSCTASSPHCGGGWTGQEITISCPECRVNVILPENGVQGKGMQVVYYRWLVGFRNYPPFTALGKLDVFCCASKGN